ncbi:type II secretion system minor pseudopilin GspH [Pseudomonas sp. MBLB4123]|uniref:type II secretion system minor pseudopilin GspH n=1 Tax=Pseudomonas sp. MBLB4123 TaxID=3451557 RepID=UPI003F750BE9
MPTARAALTPHCAGRGAVRGFTLVELLVVLVILGVLIGLAMLGPGVAGPARELHGEAERLAGLIGVLAEEAVLDNREYGLHMTDGAYQVLRYDPALGRWLPLQGKPHDLPPWAELRVELEGEALRLPQPLAEPGRRAGLTPQLLILSSGELSPFRLQLRERRRDGLRLWLSSDGFQLPRVAQDAAKGRSG